MRLDGAGAAAVTAALVLVTGCPLDFTVERNPSSVTVSNANPADGMGTLEQGTMIIQHVTGVGVEQLDKVTLSAASSGGTIAHELEIYWLPATAEVRLCQHFWTPVGGASSGSTRCAAGTANACNPATVTVDPTQEAIALNGLVLQDFLGGDATSTLTGLVSWKGNTLPGEEPH